MTQLKLCTPPQSQGISAVRSSPEPEALTIAEMITSLRRGFGRRPGVLPVPAPLLRYVFGMLGRAEAYERIAGSLIASAATLTALGWTPPVATRDGLAALARTAGQAEGTG